MVIFSNKIKMKNSFYPFEELILWNSKKKRHYKKKYYNNNKWFDFDMRFFLFFFVVLPISLILLKLNTIFLLLILSFCYILFAIFILHQKKIEDGKYMNIKTIEDMKKLDWREFEKFIEFIFRKKWFKAHVRGWINDGWVDVDASLNWQKYVIQCKKRDKYKIWVVQLREFYWVVNMMWKDYKWIYITTSKLTKEATKEFEKMKDTVELWDNSNLEEYISEFKWLENSKLETQEKKVDWEQKIIKCSKCWGNMILRKATKWKNKWKEFYGCENFPKCRNIIDIIDK